MLLSQNDKEKKNHSKQTAAYNYLLNAIIKGKFPPEKPLIEREICDSLGISRTPVREALRQLGSEGLVEFIPNRGVFIAPLTKERARQLYELKWALESMTARLFAERGTEAEIKKLAENIINHKELVQNKEMELAVETDQQFHILIIEGAHSTMLEQQAKRLLVQARVLSKLAIYDYNTDKALVFINQHQDIYDGISMHDGDAAAAAVGRHIRYIQEFQFDRWHLLF